MEFVQFPDFTRVILVFSDKLLTISGFKYTSQYNRHMVELSLVEVNIGRSPFDVDLFKTVIDHPCASVSFELTFDVDNPIGTITIIL